MEKGKLSIVATPIGNLEDMTLRAIRVLGEADMVFCEDTRVTKKLLDAYKIIVPTDSFHAQSTPGKTEKIIELLRGGKHVALVTDAGTPGISDPGTKLVSDVRTALEEDVVMEAIPGASAVVAALSAAGVPADQFLFLGFLPHKKGRQTLFGEIAESKRTVVFYESPHRILKTLQSLSEQAPEKQIVLARELTKMYEEFLRGSAPELVELLEKDPQKQKGEFVVIVSPQ